MNAPVSDAGGVGRVTVGLAAEADLAAIAGLIAAHEARRSACNPRLPPPRRREQIRTRLVAQHSGAIPPLLVHAGDGSVGGYACPVITTVPDDSGMLGFYPVRYGTPRNLTAAGPRRPRRC